MRLCLSLITCFALGLGGGMARAADPAAPARDNVPRIWRALAGDRMELDGRSFALRGVACPAPETENGRRAKALLNTYLSGTRHARRISCTIGEETADCTRAGRRASQVMLASGLCRKDREQSEPTGPDNTLAIAYRSAGESPLSYWRLQSCIGVHPGPVPRQCRLASRNWPFHHAEAVQSRERQRFSGCLTAFGPATSAFGPATAHAPPAPHSLLPFWHSRCRNVSGGH